METMEEETIGVHSLVRNTSGVEGRARAPGWGLRWVTIKSIIHMNMYKLHNKFVSVWLEHFWCTDESRSYTDS
jgi:hypothetical protein